MHLTSKDLEAVRILLDLYHESSNSSSSIAVYSTVLGQRCQQFDEMKYAPSAYLIKHILNIFNWIFTQDGSLLVNHQARKVFSSVVCRLAHGTWILFFTK